MKTLEKSRIWWALAALPFSPTASAEVIEKTALMIIQQNAVTEMSLGLPFPSTSGAETTRTYSGQFSTSFRFDINTLKVEGFKFNGGEVLTSAYGLQFQAFVTYPSPTGQRSTVVTKIPFNNVTANGVIRLSPETRKNDDGDIEFGEVDVEGKLRNLDYLFYADQGAYQTWHSINLPPASAQNVRIDNYYPGVNLLYRGTSTVDIRVASSTIYERSVRLYLTIDLDETDFSTLVGNLPRLDLDIVETEKGTIVANTGQFKIPTPYGHWATENGLNKPDPDDLNDAGIAYGILFALDLPADASSLPISTANTHAGPITKIKLPEGGLLSPMAIEYTTELDCENWPLLPNSYYLDGPNSLNLGATGEPSFGFPDGERCFIRFVTDFD